MERKVERERVGKNGRGKMGKDKEGRREGGRERSRGRELESVTCYFGGRNKKSLLI